MEHVEQSKLAYPYEWFVVKDVLLEVSVSMVEVDDIDAVGNRRVIERITKSREIFIHRRIPYDTEVDIMKRL